MPASYIADLALLPSGWASNVRIDVGATGLIERVEADSAGNGATKLAGAVVPGMPNVHSHAFQRALAGRLERPATGRDNFWTWREGMYDLASRIDPDDVQSIAEYLYVQMLEAGYTSVGEFHYLHNDPSGAPYATRTEMSDRIVAAAKNAGIELTLLLVLYRHSGFGGEPALPSQRRFVTSVDDLVAMFETLRSSTHAGIAPHSLRAVTQHELRDLLAAVGKHNGTPIHIHIAEQRREVEDCVRRYGSNPIAWLLANAPVNSAWTLVHATQLEPIETRTLAQTGAVAGLCRRPKRISATASSRPKSFCAPAERSQSVRTVTSRSIRRKSCVCSNTGNAWCIKAERFSIDITCELHAAARNRLRSTPGRSRWGSAPISLRSISKRRACGMPARNDFGRVAVRRRT